MEYIYRHDNKGENKMSTGYKIIAILDEERVKKEGIYTLKDLQNELLSLTKVYHLETKDGYFYTSNRGKNYDVDHFSDAVLEREELLYNLGSMLIITDRGTYIDCIEDFKPIKKKVY